MVLSLTMVGCNSGNFIGLAFVESVAKVKTPDEVIDPKNIKKIPANGRDLNRNPSVTTATAANTEDSVYQTIHPFNTVTAALHICFIWA